MRYKIIAQVNNSPSVPDKTVIAAMRGKDDAIWNCKRLPWPAYVTDRLTGDVIFASPGLKTKAKIYQW